MFLHSNCAIIRYLLSLVIFLPALSFSKNNIKGNEAPKWALKTLNGNYEFLDNYVAPIGSNLRKNNNGKNERKVIVQSFFATWCKPCKEEIRELQKIKKRYTNDPVEFFLINTTEYYRSQQKKDRREAENAQDWLEKNGLDKITVLEDNKGLAADSYGVTVLPRLFVIDKYQTVRLDKVPDCSKCLEELLDPLLGRLINE